MPQTPLVLQVAVPVPLRRSFDYLPPASGALPERGARVRVPFGRARSMVGVILGHGHESGLDRARLKRISEVLDDSPLIPASLMELLEWASTYYHHPIGEVLASALPARLRTGGAAEIEGESNWQITPAGQAATEPRLARAPLRRKILARLHNAEQALTAAHFADLSSNWRSALAALEALGWVSRTEQPCLPPPSEAAQAGPALGASQRAAVDAIQAAGGFQPFLLHGITGSGKTEVYLRAIDRVLELDRQALVLVPEIGLTPQLVARFRERLAVPIAVLHSGLSDAQRACAWLSAREGRAAVVLGTRSAVFTPFARLGLIVIDEEHDASYKQQDGFRYSARDVALLRASRERIPIVLGSATPSLETLEQVRTGRYQRLSLPYRAGPAALPTVELLDMRRLAADEGLSHPLRQAVEECVARGEQAILFLNRRGFAPAWFCRNCGWVAPCARCDAKLTLHRASQRLRCHHCGTEAPVPKVCGRCGGAELHALGEGTERVEQALKRYFPSARLVRIDRDTTRRKGSLEEQLERVRAGEADILVGTQMLSKGHDFPKVTLVGVLNADQGLYSVDFRAPERLLQQIVQVSGRAGRGGLPGRVLIQTYHPEHPLFVALLAHNYEGYAEGALVERREAAYPPYAHLALLRAESAVQGAALAFLRRARVLAAPHLTGNVELLDPVPSPMERRAGRYRAQLLIQSAGRRPLHALLNAWLPQLEADKESRRVRWSLDVDPIDLY